MSFLVQLHGEILATEEDDPWLVVSAKIKDRVRE